MLQVLYLHKNKLSGSLPAAWGDLAALEDLTLNENKLTGGTAVTDCTKCQVGIYILFCLGDLHVQQC